MLLVRSNYAETVGEIGRELRHEDSEIRKSLPIEQNEENRNTLCLCNRYIMCESELLSKHKLFTAIIT